MHAMRTLFSVYLTATMASAACGLELRIDPASSTPPSYGWATDTPAPKLTVSLKNDGATSVQIASLQLALKLASTGGAAASPTIGTPSLPENGLFDSLSGPSVQQRGEWTVIKFSSFPVGPLLAVDGTAPLVDLPIEGIATAAGGYELALNGFDVGQLSTSSYWVEQNSQFSFLTFTPGPAASSGGQLLAGLVVHSVPEPGAVAMLFAVGMGIGLARRPRQTC